MPYETAIGHHIPLIMLSNATYTAYDPRQRRRLVGMPSRGTLLRDRPRVHRASRSRTRWTAPRTARGHPGRRPGHAGGRGRDGHDPGDAAAEATTRRGLRATHRATPTRGTSRRSRLLASYNRDPRPESRSLTRLRWAWSPKHGAAQSPVGLTTPPRGRGSCANSVPSRSSSRFAAIVAACSNSAASASAERQRPG